MNAPANRLHFLRRFLGIALWIVAATVAVSLVVDPWNRFGLNRLGVFISASREFKLTEAARFPHDALLVGNSRTAMLPAAELKGAKFFNGAFEGASLGEIRLFLERHLHGQKLVVLNLDPYTLGPESDRIPTEAFAAPGPRVLGGYLASLKALEYSAKTIGSGLSGKPRRYLPDGTTASEEWKRQRDVDDVPWQQSQLKTQQERLAGFRFDPKRVEELRAIDALVRQRSATLVLYLSPVHEDLWPALSSEQAGDEWVKATKAVKDVFTNVVDLTHSAYSARTNYYKTDPVHFYPEVGIRFLNSEVLGPPASTR
jgi:hypothetical protein